MRRDAFQIIFNDNFQVVFDTFYDRRNAVAFMVNPIGGFFDFEISDEGNPNVDWNPVWDVRTGRFEQGWTVEMQIPFKSIRYRQTGTQLWGVQFARGVRRKNETSHLTLVPIAAQPGTFRVSAGATLVGLETPAGSTRFEVKPYGIGSSSTDLTADAPFSNKGDGDFGVDAKYGITQNVIADFTYNTDFAQGGGGPATGQPHPIQFVLSRETGVLSRRPWHLRLRGRSQVLGRGGGLNGARSAGPPGTRAGTDAPVVFFSRRIGLEDGQAMPIIGGGRRDRKVGSVQCGSAQYSDR